MLTTFKTLRIPYDKKFFNLPINHYEKLSEEIGASKVLRHVRELLMYYKDDELLSEKARILLRKLSKEFLLESVSEDEQCDCGFIFGKDQYPSCPLCNKPLYKGKGCFYKNDDGSCSQDGEDCTFTSQKECKK